MTTHHFVEIFDSILEFHPFRQNGSGSRGQIEYAKEAMNKIFAVFDNLDPLVNAMQLEPPARISRLCHEFCILLGMALRLEGPCVEKILAWAYMDLTSDNPRLLTPDRKMIVQQQIDKGILAKEKQRIHLFNQEGRPRYLVIQYFKFFEKALTKEMEVTFNENPEIFLRQILSIRTSLDTEPHTKIKAYFQCKAIEAHVDIDDHRHLYLFAGKQDAAVLSERMSQVVEDISDPVNMSYAKDIVDKLVKHAQAKRVSREDIIASFTHHLDFENDFELSFELDHYVLPAAYFIEKLKELGIDFISIFTKLLQMPVETHHATLIESVVERLPNIPKTDFLRKQEVWLGALIESHTVDQLLTLNMNAKTWSRLYLFKNDSRLRDKTQDADYLDDVLAYDLGL
jgi:hypothetical protein